MGITLRSFLHTSQTFFMTFVKAKSVQTEPSLEPKTSSFWGKVVMNLLTTI